MRHPSPNRPEHGNGRRTTGGCATGGRASHPRARDRRGTSSQDTPAARTAISATSWTRPAHHAPTLLSRSRPTGRRGDEQEFRGGCLTCDWEGPVHRGSGYGDGDNEAVEDAHDHAFPGWRTLPPITKVEDRWSVLQSRSRWAQLTSQYPAGWIDQDAPVLTWRRYRREAHIPPHAGRPRYELRVTRPPSDWGRRPTDQGVLF